MGGGYKPGVKSNTYKGGNMGGGFVNTPSTINDDYIHCDMCSRRYNEQAYGKHLPTCERRTKDSLMRDKLANKGTTGSMGYGSTTMSKPGMGSRFKK
jgi:hypothetical protein